MRPLTRWQDDLGLLGLGDVQLPGVARRLVKRDLSGGSVDADQQCPVLKHGWLSGILPYDLISVHDANIGAPEAVHLVDESWVGVYERRLDLEGRPLVHAMTMNDMGNLKATQVNVADASEFVARAIRVLLVNLFVYVREDPVALALPDLERLAVARIDEPVHVGLELLRYLGTE